MQNTHVYTYQNGMNVLEVWKHFLVRVRCKLTFSLHLKIAPQLFWWQLQNVIIVQYKWDRNKYLKKIEMGKRRI